MEHKTNSTHIYIRVYRLVLTHMNPMRIPIRERHFRILMTWCNWSIRVFNRIFSLLSLSLCLHFLYFCFPHFKCSMNANHLTGYPNLHIKSVTTNANRTFCVFHFFHCSSVFWKSFQLNCALAFLRISKQNMRDCMHFTLRFWHSVFTPCSFYSYCCCRNRFCGATTTDICAYNEPLYT